MFCKKCGKEIADNDLFCSGCGTKQVEIYKEVFVRKGISEQDFIGNINKWFQWHPKAANIKCKFDKDTSVGLFANKYELNSFEIEYELYENDNVNQYGLVKEEKLDLVGISVKDYMKEWEKTHPQATVVNWSGGTHSRGPTGSHLLGGVGASNRMNVYILFKFPRRK